MAKYSIHAGHNAFVPGARGYIKEEVVDRQIKNAVIKYLKAAGQTAYDDTDDVGKTQNENLAAIVQQVNAHSALTLAVSIHLNAGGGTGIEVYQYDSKTDAVAARVLSKVCAVTGLHNRGIKKDPSLYVLRNTESQAILVECGFVDTKTDAEIVAGKTDAIGKAIAEGILGKEIKIGNVSNQPSKPPTAKPTGSKTQTALSKAVPYPGSLIKRGSRGKNVERIQRAISITVDGIFGAKTEAAVKAYQKRHKLAVDGIVGLQTWNTLF
jgi:hypothetical protein